MTNLNIEIKNFVADAVADRENPEVRNAIINLIDDRTESAIDDIDIEGKVERALENIDFGDIVENAIDNSSSIERQIQRIAEGVLEDADMDGTIKTEIEKAIAIEVQKGAIGDFNKLTGTISEVVGIQITAQFQPRVDELFETMEAKIESQVEAIVETKMRALFETLMTQIFPKQFNQ